MQCSVSTERRKPWAHRGRHSYEPSVFTQSSDDRQSDSDNEHSSTSVTSHRQRQQLIDNAININGMIGSRAAKMNATLIVSRAQVGAEPSRAGGSVMRSKHWKRNNLQNRQSKGYNKKSLAVLFVPMDKALYYTFNNYLWSYK